MVREPDYAIKRSRYTGPGFGITNAHDILIKLIVPMFFIHTQFGYAYTVPGGIQDRYTIFAGTWVFILDD